MPHALDSLVAQTKKLFITTIVQDCDGENYDDIIEEYRRRGLQIRHLVTPQNGGPGVARQFGMDNSPMCDYFMFLDADDLLYPQAVETLYREAKLKNADLISSTFSLEQSHQPNACMDVENTPVTWCFVRGTYILSENGYKPIEKLKIGEKVYTHDGSLQPIERIFVHRADNVVKVQSVNTLPLNSTDNHKFFIYDNGQVFKRPLNQTSAEDKFILFKLPNNRTKHIDNNLAYVIGSYVGDGWNAAYEDDETLLNYITDCGKCPVDRHFPSEFLTWDNENLKFLIRGFFETGQNITTTSKRLALEMALILRTLDYDPSYMLEEIKSECSEYKIAISQLDYVSHDENFCWSENLTYTKDADALVYNITVANNHSYVAGDFVVSNCHGKIYKADYLKKNQIRFLENLRFNEDSYFNLVAVNSTRNKFKLKETTYLWRDNPNSLTRNEKDGPFFNKGWEQYITSQVQGLLDIERITGSVDPSLCAATLNNMYVNIMEAIYYKLPTDNAKQICLRLKDSAALQKNMENAAFWQTINEVVKGSILKEGALIFCKMRFCDWLKEFVIDKEI